MTYKGIAVFLFICTLILSALNFGWYIQDRDLQQELKDTKTEMLMCFMGNEDLENGG